MSGPVYTAVRTKRGRKIHAMHGPGDGAVACGRTSAGGWVVAFGRAPNCLKCLLAIAGR